MIEATFGLFEESRDFLHALGDFDMLGTLAFALPAGKAGRCFPMLLRQVPVIDAVDEALRKTAQVVVKGEILRDGDIHRAAVHAVSAARAGNRDAFVNDAGRFFDDFPFALIERPKIVHETDIILELLDIAHAAEHHQNIVERSGVADCPGSDAHFRMMRSE